MTKQGALDGDKPRMSANANLDTWNNHLRQTNAGWVQDFCRDGICRFLSVPYAAAPAGEIRFREPQPAEPWDGVRDATKPCPSSPQEMKSFPESLATPPGREVGLPIRVTDQRQLAPDIEQHDLHAAGSRSEHAPCSPLKRMKELNQSPGKHFRRHSYGKPPSPQ